MKSLDAHEARWLSLRERRTTRQRFFVGFLLAMMLTGCSYWDRQPSPAATPAKPAMVYAWTGDPTTQPSARQFAQDKYACAQDYRMTQPAIPIQRDLATELRLMTLHLETCLASKGWELRPVGPKTAPVVDKTPAGSPPPVGEPELTDRWMAEHLPQFDWVGHPAPRPSPQQFYVYIQACMKEFQDAHTALFIDTVNLRYRPFTRSTFDQFITGLDSCMRRHGYTSHPVPDRDRSAEEPWPADHVPDFHWAGEAAQAPSRQQLEKDSQACAQDFTDFHLQRDATDQMVEQLTRYLRICMKRKGYEAVPVPVVR